MPEKYRAYNIKVKSNKQLQPTAIVAAEAGRYTANGKPSVIVMRVEMEIEDCNGNRTKDPT